MLKKLALVAAVVAGTSAPAMAAVVFADDFSYGNATVLNAGSGAFGGNWETTNGTVDYIAKSGAFGSLCDGPSGGCVDLDGTTRNGGTFQTVINFAEGIYNLAFELQGNQRNAISDSVTVSFGSFVQTIALAGNGLISNVDFGGLANNIVVGPGGAKLVFDHAGGDNVGIILRSVSIEEVATAVVPLPAAGLLLVGAVGTLGALRRRKASR